MEREDTMLLQRTIDTPQLSPKAVLTLYRSLMGTTACTKWWLGEVAKAIMRQEFVNVFLTMW